MKTQRKFSRPIASVQRSTLALMLCGASVTAAFAGDSGLQWSSQSFENGDRLVVTYHLKIEHRGKSGLDILVNQAGTSEAKGLLVGAATVLGLDPTLATLAVNIAPLPHFEGRETENKGIFQSPAGLTICKAAPLGNIEASHASWSATIFRDQKNDGLSYYTAVGTSPGKTHRVEGTFFIEYVKPVPGWQDKYGCMADRTSVWNKND